MKLYSPFFLWIIFLLASPALEIPNDALAQTSAKKSLSKLPFSPILYQNLQTVFWRKGTPSTFPHSRKVLRFLEDQELLKVDVILEELEALDDQKKELKSLFDEIKRESDQFAKNLVDNQLPEKHYPQWLEFHNRFQEELESILNSRQLRRLVEIRNRIYLRFVGIGYLFSRSTLSK